METDIVVIFTIINLLIPIQIQVLHTHFGLSSHSNVYQR